MQAKDTSHPVCRCLRLDIIENQTMCSLSFHSLFPPVRHGHHGVDGILSGFLYSKALLFFLFFYILIYRFLWQEDTLTPLNPSRTQVILRFVIKLL